jgi:hypothetical protein
VVDAEHRIVDEDLDVLAEARAMPQGGVELGESNAEGLQDGANGGGG